MMARRIVLALGVALAALGAGPAGAQETTSTRASCVEVVDTYAEPILGSLGALGVRISCRPDTIDRPGLGGFWNGRTVVIVYGENRPATYQVDVLAHEAGHAWDSIMLLDTHRALVASLLGWPEYDAETFADVYALHVGHWTDYGDGWRHATPMPTPEQMTDLVRLGILPRLTTT